MVIFFIYILQDFILDFTLDLLFFIILMMTMKWHMTIWSHDMSHDVMS